MGISPTSFKPGQSGNPNGRPAGVRNKRQELSDKLMLHHLEQDGDAVMAVIKQHALEGNMKAAALFCKYVFFTPESSITINDQREANSEVAKILTPAEIKEIAEIVLKKNTNESQ